VRPTNLWIALGWSVFLAALVSAVVANPAMPFTALAAALLMAWVMARWLRRRLGGYTGDTLGAAEQLAELAVLLVWVASWSP
jgi:adenosylcobinamide-GDP ribazoletransferase